MTERAHSRWYVEAVAKSVVDRLALHHHPDPNAVDAGVDILGDPHREDDEGRSWTRLRFARNVADVTPGSAVIMGSPVGRYLAKVVAWDFEVSDDDPVVALELVPLTPESVERALHRSNSSAA